MTTSAETSLFASISDRSKKTLAGLEASLPSTEWRAVSLWLGTFYRYQLEWLLDWSDFAAIFKARQTGATHTYAAAAVLWGIYGETTTIVSLGQREADELLADAKKHAAVLRDLGSTWAAPVRSNSTELVLASGGRVIALPMTSGGRSYSGNMLLDEFAYHKNPKAVWDGASAVVMHGYRMRVMSTPNGRGNMFHDLCTNPVSNDGWSMHRTTLEDARRDGMRVDEAKCWKMAMGSRSRYAQLFECAFDAVEGALWIQAQIDALRVDRLPEDIVRGVVAIDPSVSKTDKSDETGIIGVAIDARMELYVFADASGRYSPLEWGRAAVKVYDEWELDRIIAEKNNGGDLVESNLTGIRQNVPYEAVWASRGKRARAEPVSALYERKRVHHVGHFKDLENELTSWRPLSGMPSPNRLDALVWGVSYLAFAPVKRQGRGRNLGALSMSR